MKQLIRLELVKLRKFQVLKILFGVYMLIVPGWMFFMDWFFRNNPILKEIFTKENIFEFPHLWTFITYCASFFNLLLAVIVVIVTTNEIQHKTMRQNIIEGLSKHQVIISNFVVVFFLASIATLYTFLCGLAIGMFASETGSPFDNIHLIGMYFIQTIGYFSFAFLFSIIVKRPALAIVLFILYFPVESILGRLLSRDVYQFFPLKVYADLTPMPFFNAILKAQEAAGRGEKEWIMQTDLRLVLAVVFIVISFLLSYFILKRRDI